MNRLNYYIVDVFAETKFQGNQLAVFADTAKMEDYKLLGIAKEIGFAESVFIDSMNFDKHEFKIRIFTPETEVPFAGHPNLGAAFVINKYLSKSSSNKIKLTQKAGTIPIYFDQDLIFMDQIQPTFLSEFNRFEIADLLGIDKNKISNKSPILEISTGLPYIIIKLDSIDDIDMIKIERDKFFRFLLEKKKYKDNNQSGLSTSLFIYVDSALQSENQLHARMFSYENHQVVEDAATGSANGCLLAYLLKNNYLDSTHLEYRLEQGFEMERQSIIYAKGKRLEDNRYQLRIGGKVQGVAEGKWYL